MPGSESLNTEIAVDRSCPFLGLGDDPGTSQAFPSIWNHCHRCLPTASPSLKHQREYCLGANYRGCPVYSRTYTAPMPMHLSGPMAPANQTRHIPWHRLALALAVTGALSTLAWGLLNKTVSSAQSGRAGEPGFETASLAGSSTTPAATRPAFSTGLPAGSALADLPPTTPTSGHSYPGISAAATPVRISRNQLDVLIGTDRKFVIHKVLDGESLELYMEKYDTSREAILAVSPNKEVPVWVDALMVIPVGFTDAADLPVLVVYQVKEEQRGVSTEELAKILRVDSQDFKYYNGVTEDWDRPLVGDYYIVPRPAPAP